MKDQTRMNSRTSLRSAWMILPVALVLSGCGVLGGKKGGPRTPVQGQRSSILSGTEVVAADESVASMAISFPEAQTNTEWAQSGGAASKAIGHVALGEGNQQVWSGSITGGSSRARLASPPVISGGKLYVIDTEAVINAFDAKTGARLWTSSVRSKDDQGKVQFGGGVSIEGDKIYATTGIGDVAALNAADGKVLWKVRPGGPLRGSPTLSNGNVYVMSQDNQLFALNEADGAVLWQDSGTLESTGVFGVAGPSAAQGLVFAG